MSRGIPSWPSIFNWFFTDFPSILQALEPSKSWNFLKENKVFSKNGLSKISIDFSLVLVPTCLHFPSQNPPKSHQKSIFKGIDFLIDFCIALFLIFEGFGLHLGTQVGAMLLTFSPRDGSQNTSGHSRHPLYAQDSSRTAPDLNFHASGPRI